MPGSPHNQFTFRPLPPPPPPPHACTCARKPPPTADSLQRRSMTTRSQPSPAAPTPPTSTQDSVHLHNSWVLNSNIPLETRYGPPCCSQHTGLQRVSLLRAVSTWACVLVSPPHVLPGPFCNQQREVWFHRNTLALLPSVSVQAVAFLRIRWEIIVK